MLYHSKELWKPLLIDAGFDNETISDMSTKEFVQITLTIIKSGVAPPLPPKSVFHDKKTKIAVQCAALNGILTVKEKKKEKSQKPAALTERDQQDIEYERLLHEMEEEQSKEKETGEEEEEIKEEKKGKTIKEEIMEDFKNMGPEPPNGFNIVIRMPSGKKVKRKFTKNQLGQDLYTWISSFDEMFKDDNEPLDFDIKNIMETVEPEETLEEQGIKKNAMLTLEVYDE